MGTVNGMTVRPGPITAASKQAAKFDVRVQVARVLMTREVGQRIPTVQELQALTGVGTGTVVKVLRGLESDGAISLAARGHQGTVVTSRDVGRLWNAAELGNVRLLMPPPGPVEQQAIMEVVQQTLDRVGVPVVVDFVRGARKRLAAVHEERAHLTLTSAGALDRHHETYPGLNGTDLGPSTFYRDGSLVVVEHAGRPARHPLRVGIDRASYDHEQLSEAEFGHLDPTYVDCSFVLAPAAVLAGDVDAAVWHSMPTVIPPHLAGLRLRPLTEATQAPTFDPISRAVLVTRGLDPGVNALLRHIRRPDITRAQERLNGIAAGDNSSETLWPR